MGCHQRDDRPNHDANRARGARARVVPVCWAGSGAAAATFRVPWFYMPSERNKGVHARYYFAYRVFKRNKGVHARTCFAQTGFEFQAKQRCACTRMSRLQGLQVKQRRPCTHLFRPQAQGASRPLRPALPTAAYPHRSRRPRQSDGDTWARPIRQHPSAAGTGFGVDVLRTWARPRARGPRPRLPDAPGRVR